jgi:hypothetical protein
VATARDLGRAVLKNIPTTNNAASGFGISANSVSAVVGIGSAVRSTFQTPARASDKLVEGVSKVETDPANPMSAVTRNLPSVIRNPLEKFASVNYMWTLACLTPKQFNNPSTYRNNDQVWVNDSYEDKAGNVLSSSVIFSSGGRFDSQRTKTASGVPEYYIQNFTMKTTVGANSKTGNSNAFKFEFDIFEPYSMGLLLQSFQVAANTAGYVNYLDNAPYVLKLDFMGWDELGISYKAVKSKYFVLRLTSCKFTVNEGGSTYKVEAVPYNHQGFSDAINTSYTDLKLVAGTQGTVEEILSTGPESLQAVLNKIEKKLVDDKQVGVADRYEIQFPKDSSAFQRADAPVGTQKATSNPGKPSKLVISGSNTEVITSFDKNEIGGSSLGFSQSSGGNMTFKKAGDQYDEKTGVVKRDNMTIDPKNRSFQFSQGQTLTAIINQIVVSSKYAQDAVTSVKNLKDGFIKWFRLDVQIELLDFDPITSDFAKKITYRVVPYFVHHSIFSNPNSVPIGYPKLLGRICKGYEYIYSGQNVDVLKFDIQINNMFYTGIQPGKPADAATASNQDQKGVAAQENKETKTGDGGSKAAQTANLGRSRPKRDPAQLTKVRGGTGDSNTEKQVAEQFHKAFTQSQAEMVTVNLEILGDTYWVVDSGQGNYFAATAEPQAQITEDGTMNYESGDVFIYLTFRTPLDVNEATGLYDFPKAESPFTGIYRVTMCENLFSDGIFKQKLTCIRMPGQPADYADSPSEVKSDLKTDPANALSVKLGPEEKAKTSTIDNTPPVDFT